MSSLPSIHWHEGLFLQPHHLQYQQHQLSRELAAWRELSLSYPYGLVRSEISRDALEKMQVRIDRLQMVTRNGVVLDVPGNTDLPALDINRAYKSSSESLTIRIGVPLRYESRSNTIETSTVDDWREKRIYRVREIKSIDENTGQNEQAIRVRRINARLLLPEDDDTDLETLPLLRIARGTGDDKPREDLAFIPPCLMLSGAPRLQRLVQDLAVYIQGVRGEIVAKLATGGFDPGALHGKQFANILRLRSLSRFSTSLHHLSTVQGVTPFHVYLQVTELLGELGSLRPDMDDQVFPIPPYNHDDPGVAFIELDRKIRQLAPDDDRMTWKKLSFEDRGNSHFLSLNEDDLTNWSDYFLGVLSKEQDDTHALARLIENKDKFKVMPGKMAKLLVPGVLLKWETYPPGELERPAHLHYFRLLRGDSQVMWKNVTDQKSIAIVSDQEHLDLKKYSFFLYLTKPQ